MVWDPEFRALVGELNGLGPGIRDPVQELKC
jgi:hypothetical protein